MTLGMRNASLKMHPRFRQCLGSSCHSSPFSASRKEAVRTLYPADALASRKNSDLDSINSS
jgi:hypothetical protein